MRLQVYTLLLFGIAAPAHSQWFTYRDPRTPRTTNGQPNLSAPAPRAAGKPDLSGVWQIEPSPLKELNALFPDINAFDVPGDRAEMLSKYVLNLLADFKPQEAPLQPEAARIMRELRPGMDPIMRCLPPGMPRSDLVPAPLKISQNPGLTLIADEADDPMRQIYTDGRRHTPDPPPAWMGYSIGVWDADTFVVNTVGLNDKSWLDAMGHPHSESMKVEERFHRRDFGHLDVALTIEDLALYTRPFTVKFTMDLLPDSDIIERVCAENEKDSAHIKAN